MSSTATTPAMPAGRSTIGAFFDDLHVLGEKYAKVDVA